MMWVRKKHIPIVYVCQDIPKFSLKVPCSSVNMDNRQAICDMVHLLYDMGHRNIAFISGPLHDLSAGQKRYDGYIKGMKECSLTIKKDMITFEKAFTIEDGYHGMHHIYETSSTLPTVVLCASDNMAMGAIGFLYDNNIPVPQQISITGVDDTNFAGGAFNVPYQLLRRQSVRPIPN